MGLTRRHQDLLEARGLDVELLERLGVSSSDRGTDWIEIPFWEGGRQVNTKFRTIAGLKEFNQTPGAKKCFWNGDVITDETLASLPLVITEGELDAVSAIQSGFPRAVSVPDGAPAQAQGADDNGRKYSYLVDALPSLRDVKEIILATDSDAAGVNLLNDLAVRLGKFRCKWVQYPVGCKDLNDALQRYGQRGVVETINRAQWMAIGGVYRMSELPPMNHSIGFVIGIDGLENHLKLRPGDFTVVTGIPGHGKSTFVNEIACKMAEKHAWQVAVASFEQKPQVDHRRWLRTYHNRKMVVWQTPSEVCDADQWIDDFFVFIVPTEDEDCDLGWLLERAAASVVRFNVKLVIIDPWNEMDHVRPPDMTLTEYTGYAIKQFKKLATKYNVHVIVVAHPTKMARNKDGSLPVPTLYDISDSAHWANKPDAGVVIHRKDDGRTLIRVCKSRYHDEIGEPGEIEAIYLRDQARFDVVPPELLK